MDSDSSSSETDTEKEPRENPIDSGATKNFIQGDGSDSSEKSSIKTEEDFTESRFTKDFEIGVLLGAGAYGEVLKCTHRLDKCTYAVKRIRYTGSNEILLSEVYAMSKLHHESIIRYFTSWTEVDDLTSDMNIEIVKFREDEIREEKEKDESGSDDESENSQVISYFDLREPGDVAYLPCSLFIQMEFCERTLCAAILDGPMDDQIGRGYFKEIVEGVLYMHQRGIIHRDLSSSNIFLNESSKIKIGDFGIAYVGSPDLHSSSPGQEYYREPKRSQREKIDHKADIYSLGILFLELISGIKTARERIKVITNFRTKQVLADKITSQDKKFILLCTSPDVSDRPSAEEIMQLSPWEI